ncbi:DUF6881 domain-containing protein [Cohnella silvisoli]|uniref:DUF6881 domain-containing protein n=1 Tax=Cohnella silvisoli TaxID=2873699 RepID=A0ABV1KMP5_9BACL|nr:hypothetical protein [Cohnella silvisoli]MCD9020575.1 hypothetical protein [Cohnella silvisoli]
MKYILVEWIHNNIEEPIVIYCELDEHGFEIRKVEVYKNGEYGVASNEIEWNNSFLSYEPLPSIEEIGRDSQFRPKIINEKEFQTVWEEAVKSIK